ncbi:hypothetical protein [Streptomyces sp. NPDC008121]|uniref:hypothetical protein n=1 Tax=Streptomyces sp. NPDC008121 TaxID=3364809 RepID=UPI0036F0DEEA
MPGSKKLITTVLVSAAFTPLLSAGSAFAAEGGPAPLAASSSRGHDAGPPVPGAATAPQGQPPEALPGVPPGWHEQPGTGGTGAAPVPPPTGTLAAEEDQSLSLEDALAKAKEAISGNPQLRDCTELALVSLYGKETGDVNSLETWQFSFAAPGTDDAPVHKSAVAFVDSSAGQVTLVQATSPLQDRLPSPLPAMTPGEAVKLAQAQGLASSFWRIDLQNSDPVMDGHPFFAIYPRAGASQSVYVDTVTGSVVHNP